MRAYIFAGVLALFPLLAVAQDEPERWSLTQDLRIGSISTPNYSLSEVGDLAIGSDGKIYVSQPAEAVIKVYDIQGKYLNSIGGEGGGPGEFTDLTQIGWRANSLWAVDRAPSRVNLFAPGGEVLESFRFSGPMLDVSARPTLPVALFVDGTVLGTPLTGGQADQVPLMRMSTEGEVIDSIGHISIAGKSKSIRTESFKIAFPLPIASGSFWDVSPADSSIVIVHRPFATDAESGHFVVAKLRSLTDTIFARRYTYVPKPVPVETVDSILSGYIGFWSRGMPRAEAVQLAYDSIPIPEFQAPVNHLTIGRDGTIWLQREKLGGETVDWVVLAPSGEILGTVTTPSHLIILQAQRDKVWGVVEDQLEVPYVMRYKVKSRR